VPFKSELRAWLATVADDGQVSELHTDEGEVIASGFSILYGGYRYVVGFGLTSMLPASANAHPTLGRGAVPHRRRPW
jgi:hypothetical protein